jgi:hypothetical protein
MTKATNDITPSPDASLLALCASFLDLNDYVLEQSTAPAADLRPMVQALSEQRRLLMQIQGLPVSSAEGWCAKFRVSIAVLGEPESADDADITFARTILRSYVAQECMR